MHAMRDLVMMRFFVTVMCCVGWVLANVANVLHAQDITNVLTPENIDPGLELYTAGAKAIEENKLGEGIQQIRAAIAASPNNLDFRVTLCQALAVDGQADAAWRVSREVREINKTHPAVAACLLSAWQAYTLKGLFNVGAESSDILAKLGRADRVENHANQVRWLYSFMAVNLIDQKVHSVMDLRGLDADALMTSEKLVFRADGRRWRAVHRRVTSSQTVTDYVLPAQDLSNWKELFSVQRILGLSAKLVKPADYLQSVRRDVRSLSSDAHFNIIDQNSQRAVYEWHVPTTDERTAQHGIVQVLAGERDIYRVSYASRLPEMTAEKRRTWIELVGSAKIERQPNRVERPGQPTPALIVWELGGSLGLAGVLHIQRAHEYDVARQFDKARVLAQSFHVALAPLPERSDDKEENRIAIVRYVLRTAGLPLNKKIRQEHGEDAALLFEVASKANLLLGIYEPGDSKGIAVAEAIRRAGTQSNLPKSIWQRLVERIEAKADKSEIDQIVAQMTRDVREYLAGSR